MNPRAACGSFRPRPRRARGLLRAKREGERRRRREEEVDEEGEEEREEGGEMDEETGLDPRDVATLFAMRESWGG